ncbi:hypothetical protein ACTFIY_005976 [Dictyostelium cf. discoideum]
MQSWAKVGFIKFDRLNIIDERFKYASLLLPKPTSTQLVQTTSSTEIVTFNPNDKKAITLAMRKNKEQCISAGTSIKSSYVLQMNNNLKMDVAFPASVGDVFINNSGFILVEMLESMNPNEEKLIIVDNHSSNYFVDAPTLKTVR